MLRVLHIAHVSFTRPSGPTIVLDNILPWLERMGVTVSILSTSRGTFQENRWHRSSRLEKWTIPFSNELDVFSSKFNNILSNINVAHIHGVFNYKHSLIAMRLKSEKIPYVITPHGQLQTDAIKHHSIKKRIAISTVLRPMLMNTNGMHVFSEAENRRLDRCFSKFSKIYIIPNGITPSRAFAEKSDFNDLLIKKRAECYRVFCYAGRLDITHKGLDMFANAVIAIKDKLRERGIKIWLVGNYLSRRDQMALEKKLKKMKDTIVYWGQRSLFEKNLIVSKSDVFFHTSRNEGMPLAVLEAMQMGIPVLVTEGTNMGKIVQRSSGGWVVLNDIQEIKKAFLNLANIDFSILRNKGKCGRKYVNKYMTWEQVSHKIYNMYKDLVGN